MTDVTGTPRKKLAVIDGKSVFYRGYYAMPNLATKDGTPTGGVFGFATMALEVIRRLKPDYVAVAWDKPKTNIRRRLELYPEYKAGRKPAPKDFYEQIPVLQELLKAFGWPLYEFDDYEADDIMGTLAVQATKQGIETMLITSDMDMLQLVNPLVHVYALKKGLSNIELYSPKSFEAKYGISVSQFLDLKALKGDSSDNIPGVPGVGEKTAVQLLQEYQTLDNIYANLPLIKESVRKKLETGKDSAYLSRELADIWTNAPMKLDTNEVDGTKADPAAIQAMLQKLEFRTLARQLPEVMQVSADALPSSHAGIQLAVGKNTMITTKGDLLKVKLEGERLFVHSRSSGKHGKGPQLLIISTNGKDTYSIDLEKIERNDLQKFLKQIPALVGHDVKATMQVLLELGVNLPLVSHDTLIASFVLNALRREQTLTALAESDLGYEGSSFEDLDTDELVSRAAEIVAVLKALYEQQTKALADTPKLTDLVKDVEWPIIPVLARMEYEGIEIDTQYLQDFSKEMDASISDLEKQIYSDAGQEFKIGSPAQLGDILFEKLQLSKAGIKRGKTGYSTDVKTLEKLQEAHPIIPLISQWREVTKLKNTYIDTLPELADNSSRVHTTFNLTVAQTGRLSSTDPNLQNIPVRTPLGARIRTAFVAGPGKKLVSADYSQFELRLAAVMADDKELIEMFNRGADIHTATAALVYERNIEDVSKQMRRAAKTINFGILYGMSPHGLAVGTGMTRDQAVKFIDRYKAVRKPLFDYMDRVRQEARDQGYVETLHGRRRPMPDIHSSNFVVRQAAERAAINMPIQGTEADLMKLAMIHVEQLLHPVRTTIEQPLNPNLLDVLEGTEHVTDYPDAKMLLQIHDSILIECDAANADKVAAILKVTMESVYKLPVRLDVDVTIGDNWGEL